MPYPQSDTCQIPDLYKIYEEQFGLPYGGFFVDVGAFDGYRYSNTWGLAMTSWNGICFEPVPEYYLRCAKLYKDFPGIRVIKKAIGNKNGILEMELAGADSSGSNHQLEIMHNTYLSAGFTGEKIKVEMATLDSELDRLVAPRKFEVLSLDPEGMTLEILYSFDIRYWKPRLVIVETQKKHDIREMTHDAPLIHDYMTLYGYLEIYGDAINSIYKRL